MTDYASRVDPFLSIVRWNSVEHTCFFSSLINLRCCRNIRSRSSMSTSGRRIDLTAAGDEGYFFTRSNPHASPPTRSAFLPFSSQSPAKTAPSLFDKTDLRVEMRRQRPSSFIVPSVDDPITRPGNGLSKAFELVDDIEDISATQWEAEASKSSRTESSQTDAGGSRAECDIRLPTQPARQ